VVDRGSGRSVQLHVGGFSKTRRISGGGGKRRDFGSHRKWLLPSGKKEALKSQHYAGGRESPGNRKQLPSGFCQIGKALRCARILLIFGGEGREGVVRLLCVKKRLGGLLDEGKNTTDYNPLHRGCTMLFFTRKGTALIEPPRGGKTSEGLNWIFRGTKGTTGNYLRDRKSNVWSCLG